MRRRCQLQILVDLEWRMQHAQNFCSRDVGDGQLPSFGMAGAKSHSFLTSVAGDAPVLLQLVLVVLGDGFEGLGGGALGVSLLEYGFEYPCRTPQSPGCNCMSSGSERRIRTSKPGQ